MPKKSAGLLPFRETGGSLEVLLVHPGGPFWSNKDDGSWSIAKGEFGEGEDPLLAAQRTVSPAVERGVLYLIETQNDGTWDEVPFTGTGFPGHFYLRYTMYREYFPLMALGQARAALEAAVTVPLSFETERVAVARAPLTLGSERDAASA